MPRTITHSQKRAVVSISLLFPSWFILRVSRIHIQRIPRTTFWILCSNNSSAEERVLLFIGKTILLFSSPLGCIYLHRLGSPVKCQLGMRGLRDTVSQSLVLREAMFHHYVWRQPQMPPRWMRKTLPSISIISFCFCQVNKHAQNRTVTDFKKYCEEIRWVSVIANDNVSRAKHLPQDDHAVSEGWGELWTQLQVQAEAKTNKAPPHKLEPGSKNLLSLKCKQGWGIQINW